MRWIIIFALILLGAVTTVTALSNENLTAENSKAPLAPETTTAESGPPAIRGANPVQ